MNRYPLWKYAILLGRAGGGGALHPAQFLWRGARGAGVLGPLHRQGRRLHDGPGGAGAGGGRHRARGDHAGRQLGQGADGQHRRPAQGARCHPARAGAQPRRRILCGGAEPAVRLAALAVGDRRRPDVPGAGPARWRALHAAGGHAGGADPARGVDGRRPAHPVARSRCAPRRHRPQRPADRGAPARSADRGGGAAGAAGPVPGPAGGREPGRQRVQAGRQLQARGRPPGAGAGPQAEHDHPAQPDQRAGRGRAGDPAAGAGPHRGAVARGAGHRPRQEHPGAHRHPRDAAGGRELRGARRRDWAPAPCPSARSATSSAKAAR